MTMRSKRLTGAALCVAASLTLAACGGGDDETETGTETATESESPAAAAEGDGTLTVGSLLPQTGNLAFLGPPEFAGVKLAINEINEAGGVLDQDVAYIEGDSGDTSQDIANPTVDRLLAANVDVIIGAASSGVSLTVIDKITRAGVVQYSPANTAADFTDYDDNGLYFRTAPPDILQGRILGETILADGCTEVGVLALQDPYGEGLAQFVGETVTGGGGTLTPEEPIFYDPAASNFDAQVNELKAANPGCVVLIGFEESAKVIQSMVSAGIGPQQSPLYLVDGNLGNALGEDLPAGVLAGAKGSLPGAEATPEFRERLLAVDPALKDYSYAAESYDAVITSALAALVAESDSGEAIGAELPGVTKEGEKCTTFEECKTMIEAGDDIDYDGVSGPIELNDVGDPTAASIGIYTFGPDNRLTADVQFQQGEV
jgi:ABC-type branched-subunit amino acid transport system substrate-binding protein